MVKKINKVGKKVKLSIAAVKFTDKKLVKKRALRRVMRDAKITVNVKEQEVEPILEDPNRFFKSKYEEDRRRLFFK